MTHEYIDGYNGALGDFARAKFVRSCPNEWTSNLRGSRVRLASTRDNEKLHWPVDLGNIESR